MSESAIDCIAFSFACFVVVVGTACLWGLTVWAWIERRKEERERRVFEQIRALRYAREIGVMQPGVTITESRNAP